jgi:endoglucanase
VTLTAAAASGSTFAGWGGACTGTAGCTVSMTQARTVTATFNSSPTGNGGVTVAATTGGSPPWYLENRFTFANTATVTAMTITVVVQRTPGITFNGIYNTVGSFTQSNTGNTNPAAITYTWTLSGQMGPGAGRLFVAQTNGNGTAHPSAGDTWTLTYTVGGQNFTQSGTF